MASKHTSNKVDPSGSDSGVPPPSQDKHNPPNDWNDSSKVIPGIATFCVLE